MEETDNFALVPRPPGALEKAEPGTKRILSSMVADTLALVKKDGLPRNSRPLRIVMVNDETYVLESFGLVIRGWFPNATVLSFSNGAMALEELSQTEPDLLITDDRMPVMSGGELCERLLDREVTYPIIVNSPWEPTEQWVRELAGQGLNVFFLPVPCDVESLRKAVEAAGFEIPRDTIEIPAETAPQPYRTRPPRIVVVDDESGPLEMFALLIRDWFKDVTLLEFSNSSDAWQELSRTDPDLLILDMPLTGVDMLPLLAERKVKYPIFVTSGIYGEKEMQQHAGPNLKVSCLFKPFTIEQFNRCLLTHVGPSDNPKFARGEP
jgi:Response regulator containing a CheY-like receiver domain and an HTH DNA-binding domain